MITALIIGLYTEEKNLNELYCFAFKITITQEDDRIARVIGKPKYPKYLMKIGTIIHVATVQIIIKTKETFTFPNALKRLINGVE